MDIRVVPSLAGNHAVCSGYILYSSGTDFPTPGKYSPDDCFPDHVSAPYGKPDKRNPQPAERTFNHGPPIPDRTVEQVDASHLSAVEAIPV